MYHYRSKGQQVFRGPMCPLVLQMDLTKWHTVLFLIHGGLGFFKLLVVFH